MISSITAIRLLFTYGSCRLMISVSKTEINSNANRLKFVRANILFPGGNNNARQALIILSDIKCVPGMYCIMYIPMTPTRDENTRQIGRIIHLYITALGIRMILSRDQGAEKLWFSRGISDVTRLMYLGCCKDVMLESDIQGFYVWVCIYRRVLHG